MPTLADGHRECGDPLIEDALAGLAVRKRRHRRRDRRARGGEQRGDRVGGDAGDRRPGEQLAAEGRDVLFERLEAACLHVESVRIDRVDDQGGEGAAIDRDKREAAGADVGARSLDAYVPDLGAHEVVVGDDAQGERPDRTRWQSRRCQLGDYRTTKLQQSQTAVAHDREDRLRDVRQAGNAHRDARLARRRIDIDEHLHVIPGRVAEHGEVADPVSRNGRRERTCRQRPCRSEHAAVIRHRERGLVAFARTAGGRRTARP